MEFIAKTFHGLEDILAEELTILGAKKVVPIKRGVSFEGNLEVLYKANLHCRTALRILKPFYTFEAQNEDQLYRRISDYNWSKVLSLRTTFAIDSVVYSKHFRHSKYVALKIKDAIADQFRKKTGRRPSIDTDQPDIQINVHVSHTRFSISLDSSGESLHKRGYRNQGHKAPVNEVLAAGMLLLTAWNGEVPLIDPMCGSGTILTEAALIASNIPPGLRRRQFGFMKWMDYDGEIWARVMKAARSEIKQTDVRLSGADISYRSVAIAQKTIDQLGLQNNVIIQESDFTNLYTNEKSGMIIMNPPYGERMKPADLFTLYKEIGDHLKQHFTGFDAWIISSNRQALKHIGLRPSKKITLFNGPLECSFQHFPLYKGSKREK